MPSLQEMTRRWAVAARIAVLLSGLVFGQEAVKPVTVCEVLANAKAFSGKPVAIVGRLECHWSLIDHTCYLAEGRCERPVTTEGYVWPNKILLAGYRQERFCSSTICLDQYISRNRVSILCDGKARTSNRQT
jgi:hypothetical protein